ncbi:hypothetical protein B0A49_08986 [Cryomyces minteri]|uniref:ferric-chelate reductase (NADPH) n=1 Tax=Cryomyces minteri TaxID=331657 RepID=A0A4U0WRE6_9PEZI|nr:hypothetical protein B0A49_08986 [Cryomyces minteri]
MFWHFVNLTTDAEKQRRRDLLDLYASVAQASVAIPLLTIQLYFFSSLVIKKWRKGADEEDPPGSPYMKHERAREKSRTWKLRGAFRRLAWWAGERVNVFGYDLGKRGEVLVAAGWMVWLLFLSISQTGDDYLHLTKRFGIVGASQLPLHYLLALKSPLSPLQYLTGLSHSDLNIFHQLLGRLVTVLFYAHSVLYLNFFIQSNLLAKRIRNRDVLLGLTAITCFTLIGTTALGFLRRWNYRVFYTTHVVLATALLPVLFYHVHHIRIYIYEVATIYLVQSLLRYITTATYPASLILVPGTNLLQIKVPLDSRSLRTRWSQAHYHPGQHVYAALPAPYPRLLRNLRTNPFTIANLPHRDRELRLVARILNGNTRRLAALAAGNKTTVPVVLEGPYGPADHLATLMTCDRILLVAGGVGATFTIPLYRALRAAAEARGDGAARRRVRVVWAVRSAAETDWALPPDAGARERRAFEEDVEIYVTRGRVGDGIAEPSGARATPPPPTHAADDIELESQEHEGLLNSRPDQPHTAKPLSTIRYTRPDLHSIVSETFAGGSGETVAVFVCGPVGLSSALRREVGRWTGRGREVIWWAEEFGW